MLPHTPEDWPGSFQRHINEGDLEAALSLYDPNAVFTSPDGETVVGREGIRSALSGLLEKGTHMEARVVRVVRVDDIAMLYTDWRLDSRLPSEPPAASSHRAIEILSRQRDGTWRLIMGDPTGRG